jgi:hypothetical protein
LLTALLGIAAALGTGAGVAHAEPTELPAGYAYNYGEQETPRTGAMAGATRALGNSTSAVLQNPAGMGLTRVYHIEALGQWTPEAARQVYGGCIVDSTRRLAGALALFGGFIDPDGFDRSYLDLKLALSFLLSKEFSFGMGGRYLKLDQEGYGPLGDSRASGGLLDPDDMPQGRDALVNTVTFDAGLVLRATDELHIGVVGKNLAYADNALLPTTLGGGVGYGSEDFSIEVDGLADFNSWLDISGRVMAGGEYLAGDHFPLRLGYRFDQGAMSHELSGGLGYVERRFSVEASVRRTLAGPSATLIFVGLAYHLESSGLIGIAQ